MSAIAVSDSRSNAPEQIEFAVRKIGRSEIRRNVFAAIYRGKRDPKTVLEISKTLGVTEKQVLDAGKQLANNDIIKQTKVAKKTAYGKYPFFSSHRDQILKLVANPQKLKSLSTKRNPKVTVNVEKIAVPLKRIKAKQLTVDDIDSFKPTVPIGSAPVIDLTTISEKDFKKGIQSMIGESGSFTDWGGEPNDLLTTLVLFKGKRVQTAFAFKGPGKRGVLKPKGMGKNGDQIQRLFKSPATLFIVQYWGQIDQTVIEQCSDFAKLKSVIEGEQIYFCVIDGSDTQRIVDSWPLHFS